MARQAKIDDIAPDLVSAQQLAQRFYAPALGSVSDPIEWSPSNMQWIAK